MRKKFITILTSLCLFVGLLSGCVFPTIKNEVSNSGFYFNTIINITLYNTNNSKLIDDCFDIAHKYENMFSNTIPESDISKINDNAGIKSVKVNPETIELLNSAIKYCELSNGKFDITIGKLSELWNISKISQSIKNDENITDDSVIPKESDILALVNHINFHNIIIDSNSVYLSDSDAKIDLGGIAKGFVADKMKEYLLENGINSAIINLGGNVLTIGSNSNGNSFNVGIQKPFNKSGEIITKIPVISKSVVTSGIYERYYKVDDVIYHHLLDSKTGYPINNNLLSVTIISDSSTEGDALSTICFSLGLDEGMNLINQTDNIEAIFITDDYELHYSDGL